MIRALALATPPPRERLATETTKATDLGATDVNRATSEPRRTAVTGSLRDEQTPVVRELGRALAVERGDEVVLGLGLLGHA